MMDISEILQNETELREQIETLSGSSLPLDIKEVTDQYVQVEFKEFLDECKTEEERENRKKKLVEHYITGPGKQFITNCVNKVNSAYLNLKNTVENIKDSLNSLIASLVIPSVITTPPGTPNVAWTVLDNRQKVKVILSLIDQVNQTTINLYSVALLIHLPIPPEVTAVTAGLAALSSIIMSIPI